jgi:putative transcriptional regulator
MTDSIQGQVLIAAPMLCDPNFFRAVVYIAKHDAEGAFGVVLNRPSNMRLEDVIEQARGRRPARSDAIYLGGPVEGPLLALHGQQNLGEPCTDDIWLTSDDDHLMLLCDQLGIEARFFSGYSGWGPGQLEQELAAGGWLIGPLERDYLFGNPDDIWEDSVKIQGREVLRAVVPAAGLVDPQVN